MLRRFLVVLCLLTCLAGARLPEVGDHVMIEVSMTDHINILYDCFILNLTESLVGVRSLAYTIGNDTVYESSVEEDRVGKEICLGTNAIKRIDWVD